MGLVLNIHWHTVLFVPGNRPERFAKAFSSNADAVCIDLEDAVSENEKPAARDYVLTALTRPQSLDLAVRLNVAGSANYDADLEKLCDIPDTTLMCLPKAHLRSVQILMQDFSKHPIIAVLEDAQGIEEAYEIAVQPEVVGLLFGGGDLAAQLGVSMSWDALLYSRSRLLLAAANADCLAIDVPCLALRDIDQIYNETLRIKDLGYRAKAAIHPEQIEPIRRAFAPTASEIVEAEAMLDVFAQSGGDAVSFNGKMLDKPILKAARRILTLAKTSSS